MGYLLSIVAVILWGLVQIPIKIAKAPGRVGVMVSMPAGIAAVVLILLFQGNLVLPEAVGRDWFLILLTGVATFPVATYMYFEAVKRAGITSAAPITRLTPVIVVVACAALGIQALSWPVAFAALTVFIGGVFLARGAGRAHPIESRRDLKIGLTYALIACVMWAVGYVGVGQISEQIPRILVLFYGLGFGAVLHWAVMAALGRLKELRKLKRLDVLCYCIQGVGSFALGYWAMFESISYLGSDKSAVISGTWPVVGVAAGIVVFREPMNRQKLVGVVLLILSAVLVGIDPFF
ncbi:MAG TPA: DMT family transporter [Planctomycetota bacterium]|nr:DMT family transporter [Planctomycetota bacterium]HUW55064.1 DMT family transporter [Planctomycetota bacterium]